MSIYKKKISSGVRFFVKGEDIKDGDTITIANEGREEEGKFGSQNIFLVKINDEEGAVSFNQTSINCLIDGYGEDSINWIGKEAKVEVIKQMVAGKMQKVFYFIHPDAEMDDDSGQFLLSGNKDIPVAGEPSEAELSEANEEAGK